MGQSTFDEKLIARIAAGDRAAFAKVYEATKSSVYGLALSIVKNRADAEDVMHDSYLKLYRGAQSYRPQGKPLAFILTIVKNTAYNKLRAGQRQELIPHDGLTAEERQDGIGQSRSESARNKTGNSYGQIEDRIVLDAALEVLDDTESQIVLMHAVTGYKHREIAEMLALNPSTVLSKYRRALEKMRDELERKGVPL